MASFAAFKEIKDFSEIELNQLKEHCFRGHVKVGGHFLFHGKDGDDYGMTRFTFRNQSFKFRRHCLALCIKLFDSGSSLAAWDDNLEASHLCHKKRCYNPDHLILEEHYKNKERDPCVTQGECAGHGDSPNCILITL